MDDNENVIAGLTQIFGLGGYPFLWDSSVSLSSLFDTNIYTRDELLAIWPKVYSLSLPM
jgi:hypothetical protein